MLNQESAEVTLTHYGDSFGSDIYKEKKDTVNNNRLVTDDNATEKTLETMKLILRENEKSGCKVTLILSKYDGRNVAKLSPSPSSS